MDVASKMACEADKMDEMTVDGKGPTSLQAPNSHGYFRFFRSVYRALCLLSLGWQLFGAGFVGLCACYVRKSQKHFALERAGHRSLWMKL